MKAALRQKAIKLRTEKRLSYSAIQKKLKISRSTLSYWLQEYPLTKNEIEILRRKGWLKGEAGRERFRISMQKKRIAVEQEIYEKQKNRLAKIKRESFFTAGLMLYLGEGDKKNKARVGLANTDPTVIKFFIKWLQEFLNTKREKMHIELHLYKNMDITKEENFWKNITGIPKEQFYKTQITRPLKRFLYQGPERHGTCSVIVNSVQSKRELMMAVKALLDLYNN